MSASFVKIHVSLMFVCSFTITRHKRPKIFVRHRNSVYNVFLNPLRQCSFLSLLRLNGFFIGGFHKNYVNFRLYCVALISVVLSRLNKQLRHRKRSCVKEREPIQKELHNEKYSSVQSSQIAD